MKKLLAVLGLLLLALAAVVLARTWIFPTPQPPAEERLEIAVDGKGAAERLAQALTYPTISHLEPEKIDTQAFRDLHDHLEVSYPIIHSWLSRETVSGLSLLYTWQGRDLSLDPVVLMGHQDVVPVSPGTGGEWQHPPFGGVVADGFVWGRGAMDNKNSVVATLEAVEALLEDGFQPRRTHYLAFGHDEEIGGARGAKVILDLLSSRGVSGFALVVDEGGAIVDGDRLGLSSPVAMIGVAEKGYLSLELTVSSPGGHSSMPPRSSAIGILSRAIQRLEDEPFPARLDGATLEMVRHLSPAMPFARRMVLSNLWLTRGRVLARMTDPSTAFLVRTTTAATIFEAGVKDNVLPARARAVVNFRILPGETVGSVTARVREIIADERVQVATFGEARDPSPVSRSDSTAYGLLAKTLRQVARTNELLITPYLVGGGTDAKYYAERSDAVYRLFAGWIPREDMVGFHGTNERLSIESLESAIRFTQQLIRNTDQL